MVPQKGAPFKRQARADHRPSARTDGREGGGGSISTRCLFVYLLFIRSAAIFSQLLFYLFIRLFVCSVIIICISNSRLLCFSSCLSSTPPPPIDPLGEPGVRGSTRCPPKGPHPLPRLRCDRRLRRPRRRRQELPGDPRRGLKSRGGVRVLIYK
jgi:hypothetical protein